MNTKRIIERAKVHTEETRRGWRFALMTSDDATLSMISYRTEYLAIEAAEDQRKQLLEMVTA